jgi:hypothetical protein
MPLQRFVKNNKSMEKKIIFLILLGIFFIIPVFAFGQYYNTGYYQPSYYDYGYNGYDGYSGYNYDNYGYNNYGYDYGYNNYDYNYGYDYGYNNYDYNYGYDYGYNTGYSSVAYPTYDYGYSYSPYSYNNYSYPYNYNNYSYDNYSYPYNYNNCSYNNGYTGYNQNYYYGTGYNYYPYNNCNNNNQNQCQSNSYQSCSGGNLYWYNSCGTIGSQISNCGTPYLTGNKRCSGSLVQSEKIDRGCSGNSCYSNTIWENGENCAASGRTCSNGTCSNYNDTSNLSVSCYIYPSYVSTGQEVVFYANLYGGSGNYSYSWSGDCSGSNRECRTTFQSSGSKTATVSVTSNSQMSSAVCSLNVGARDGWYSNSYLACYDNDLYWYDRYNNRTTKSQDCQSNLGCTYGSPYCSGNSVYRQKTCQNGQCVNNSCRTTSYTQTEFVESCGNSVACSAGHCYPWVY